jgi:hypothetical protein
MKIAKEVMGEKVNNTIYLDWKHETEKNPIARVNNMLQNDPKIRKPKRFKKSSKRHETRFFMVDLQLSTANEFSNNRYKNKYDLVILHRNIQSLGNTVMALNVLLGSWVTKPAVLCFSEHWLNKEHLLQINIGYYKLSANFCKISDMGVPVYVLNDIKTKELTFVRNLTGKVYLKFRLLK